MTAPNEVVKRPNLRHGAAHHHRDAQTAKPQTFRASSRRFPYNLAANLAQIQG